MTDTTTIRKSKPIIKPWTPAEVGFLRELVEAGKNGQEIASALGRSRPAIWQRARDMGLKLAASPKRWTADHDKTLTRLAATQTYAEIGNILNRSTDAVKARAKELKICRPWCKEDVENLRIMHAQGAPVHDIAKSLEMPVISVHHRLYELGMSKMGSAQIGSELVNGHGYLIRKISETGSYRKDWKRVDFIEWEAIHGEIPEGYCLMVINNFQPRTPDNFRLIKKEERWSTIIGSKLSPEIRQLIAIQRHIVRASKKQNESCAMS